MVRVSYRDETLEKEVVEIAEDVSTKEVSASVGLSPQLTT